MESTDIQNVVEGVTQAQEVGNDTYKTSALELVGAAAVIYVVAWTARKTWKKAVLRQARKIQNEEK